MESTLKTAVLVVSFGTTHLDALDSAIGKVEAAITQAVAPIPVFRAFTSTRVIDTLKKERSIVVKKPLEALQALIEEGYDRIVVQPLHVIPGFEFDKLQKDVRIAAHQKGIQILLGRPLLSKHEDYLALIEALEAEMCRQGFLDNMDAIIWLGHGTAHAANACYVYLERLWKEKRDSVFVVNLEGYPEIHHILPALQGKYQRLLVLPLLIVAGDHAKKDMAGEENSLKTILESHGFEVKPILKGLGDYPGVAHIFVNRVKGLVLGE